jgi:hypothetical protein
MKQEFKTFDEYLVEYKSIINEIKTHLITYIKQQCEQAINEFTFPRDIQSQGLATLQFIKKYGLKNSNV